jgi:hypothetical protein
MAPQGRFRATARGAWQYYRAWPGEAFRAMRTHVRAHLGWELALVVAVGIVGLVGGGGIGAAVSALAAVGLICLVTFLVDFVLTPVRRQRREQEQRQQAEGERDQAQAELIELRTPEFDCVGNLEAVEEDAHMTVNGRVFRFHAHAWVEVTNRGPTSDFTARIPQVTGVPSGWGNPYKVIQPAWEDRPSSTTTIERGGTRRLKLAAVLWRPRAFWFYTTQWGEQMPGNQFIIPDDEAGRINFVLEIVNVGAEDRTLQKRGSFFIPLDAKQASFTLDDPPDQEA